MFIASVCLMHIPQLKEFDGHCELYYSKKVLNYFVYVEVWILEEKCNIYETHIFPRSLVQTCWLGSISMCLNTQLSVKKIQILIIFLKFK